jgi:hypothetical protein
MRRILHRPAGQGLYVSPSNKHNYNHKCCSTLIYLLVYVDSFGRITRCQQVLVLTTALRWMSSQLVWTRFICSNWGSTIFGDITPCSPSNINANCFHAGFLLGLFFDPEHKGDTFLRNVGWHSAAYTTLHPKRWYSLSGSVQDAMATSREPFVKWAGIYWLAERLSASKEGLYSKEGPFSSRHTPLCPEWTVTYHWIPERNLRYSLASWCNFMQSLVSEWNITNPFSVET